MQKGKENNEYRMMNEECRSLNSLHHSIFVIRYSELFCIHNALKCRRRLRRRRRKKKNILNP
ncbi:hypothetical protein H8E88_17360 [candidate division KSB1 bacterium]|nr:hypothetical protein [candidate division KSB1 bacterium]